VPLAAITKGLAEGSAPTDPPGLLPARDPEHDVSTDEQPAARRPSAIEEPSLEARPASALFPNALGAAEVSASFGNEPSASVARRHLIEEPALPAPRSSAPSDDPLEATVSSSGTSGLLDALSGQAVEAGPTAVSIAESPERNDGRTIAQAVAPMFFDDSRTTVERDDSSRVDKTVLDVSLASMAAEAAQDRGSKPLDFENEVTHLGERTVARVVLHEPGEDPTRLDARIEPQKRPSQPMRASPSPPPNEVEMVREVPRLTPAPIARTPGIPKGPTPPRPPPRPLRPSAGPANSWSDEEAGRRAVETRNSPGLQRPIALLEPALGMQPAPAGPPPLAVPHPPPSAPPPPQELLDSQQFAPWVASAFAAVALAAALYVAFFTKALWPVLKVDTEPPGAMIYVDGRPLPVRAPVELKLKPNTPHFIEARSAGYRSRSLETPISLRFLGSGNVALTLEKNRHVLHLHPAPGQVFVNGRLVGEGSDIELPALPDGKLELKVVAPGFKPYKLSVENGAGVPESLDAQLEKAE
jgi:hypothetical protein